MGSLSVQAAAETHHTAFMETTARVWTMMVPFIVLDLAPGVDKSLIGGRFHVLLRSCETARHCPVRNLWTRLKNKARLPNYESEERCVCAKRED